MPIYKCTTGFVIQKFEDDGTPINQEFFANDQVEWEDETGDLLEEQDYSYYFPYEMVQPAIINTDLLRLVDAVTNVTQSAETGHPPDRDYIYELRLALEKIERKNRTT